MNSARQRLILVLEEVTNLLHECGHEDKASWFRKHLQQIREYTDDSPALTDVARSVRSVIAGIGSLSDLSLIPRRDSHLSIREAHDRQWQLVDELDIATEQLVK